MRIHAIFYNDSKGDLVDVEYFGSRVCMENKLAELGIANSSPAGETSEFSWGRWPGGSETDYDVYCAGCGSLLWRGMMSEERGEEGGEKEIWNPQLIERFT